MTSHVSDAIAYVMYRVAGNPKTTAVGGALGVAVAAIIGKVEELTGCHFVEAFNGVDWAQVVGFTAVQLFGAFVTDGNKLTTETFNERKSKARSRFKSRSRSTVL